MTYAIGDATEHTAECGHVTLFHYEKLSLLGRVRSVEIDLQLPDSPFCVLCSTIASIPNFVRPFLAWVLKNVAGDERKASILG